LLFVNAGFPYLIRSESNPFLKKCAKIEKIRKEASTFSLSVILARN
jgi:hypothetical protein